MAGLRRKHDRKRSSTQLLLRAGTLVLAIMAASAQMAEVAHYALVPHSVCSEHGEVIHAGSHAAPDTAGARAHTHAGKSAVADAFANARAESRPASRSASRSAWLPVTTEASDDHDHCLISALRKQGAAVLSASAVFIPQGNREGSAAFARELAPPPAIALLDQAPKSSPPFA